MNKQRLTEYVEDYLDGEHWKQEVLYLEKADYEMILKALKAQPDGISLEWINKHLEWLDNCDNDFAQLAKVSIRAMVELWKKDRI